MTLCTPQGMLVSNIYQVLKTFLSSALGGFTSSGLKFGNPGLGSEDHLVLWKVKEELKQGS